MEKRLYPILISIILALVIAFPGAAQEEEKLVLRLNRDFGYGGMGNDIQGFFSLEVRNPPSNLSRVEFTIDGTLLGTDDQAPFKIQFSTDSYPLGEHVISATGYTSDGQNLPANEFQMDFVSPEAGWQSVIKIIGPILAIVFGVILLSYLISFLTSRKRPPVLPGAPRNYGLKGGAICPKCSRPFAFQIMSLNIGLFHKIDRCPHCGRWGFVRRRSLEELRAAEAAEVEEIQKFIREATQEDKLSKELDDSRYQNS